MQYAKELETALLYFVGSIAYFAKEYIANQLDSKGLKVTCFICKPIDNLIRNQRIDSLIH